MLSKVQDLVEGLFSNSATGLLTLRAGASELFSLSFLPDNISDEGRVRGRRKVLFVTDHYRNEVLLGIVDFARSRDWFLDTDMRFNGTFPNETTADGILVLGSSERIENWLQGWKGTPVVYLGGAKGESPASVVEPDFEQAAQDAVRHLLNLGLFNFAFCGNPASASSIRMREIFFEQLKTSYRVESLNYEDFPKDEFGISRRTPRLEWLASELKGLTKPVGIFVDDDGVSLELVLACELAGFRIPHEVAILGCGNSEIEISLSQIALSSVDLNWRRVGRAGARLLSEIMDGKEGSKRIFVKPLGVFGRASTSTFATSNPMITRVIIYIRQHYAENLRSAELAKMAGMSERAFRSEFKELVGHSPRTEIFRTRLAAARRLLRDTNHKLDAIALESGFTNARKLCTVFAEVHHLTPSAWRDQARGN